MCQRVGLKTWFIGDAMKKLILITTLIALLAASLCGCIDNKASVNRNGYDIVEGTSVSEEIGNLVIIDVFVNGVKADTPVHRNKEQPNSIRPYNLGDYVLLLPIYEAMGATFEVKDGYIEILYEKEIYELSR